LKDTASHCIWLRQGEPRLEGNVATPEELRGLEAILLTDASWGPQDASQPKENEARTAKMEELKPIQGFYLARMGGPLLWGAQREKRGSRSSCMAELKAVDEGIKGIQYLRHLMKQLGLPGIDCPTPALNDNRGSVDWIDSGCKPTKKLRHENLAELGIAEAKQHGGASFCWIPGKASPAGIFTKEGNDTQHCCSLRDLMVMAREKFIDESNSGKNNSHDEIKDESTDEGKEMPSKTLEEVHGKESIGSSGMLASQPCARWADIVKGRCKRPAPPAMGGAEKHPWLKSIQG